MEILQKVHLVHTVSVFSNLDISKDSESLISLMYCYNSTTHTFFTKCQEVFPSLKDVYEILQLCLFGDGEMANVSLSPDEAKVVKFLEKAVKKTLKKPILKAVRKGKAPSDEVPKNVSVGVDKGCKVNFWGWIRYFLREYADGMNEEASLDSLKEGTNFVVGEGNSSPFELEAFLAFSPFFFFFLEGYPHEKILGRHFPLAVKFAKGYSFPLALYFLGILYSHSDHFTLDLQRSWGRF